MEADLSRAEEVDALAAAARERFGGPPDVLVSAARALDPSPLADMPVSELDRQIRVNLRAPLLLVRAFLPGMLARGSGEVVLIGFAGGAGPFPHGAAYAASTYGLRGLHEVLRQEVAGTGVRATLVEPGGGGAGEVAAAIVSRLRTEDRGRDIRAAAQGSR